jgi:hypothetical protein
MSNPDAALKKLATAIGCPLAFDDAGQCGIEFDGGRLVVLHRRDPATLSIRIPLNRIDAIADADRRLALLERVLAANYACAPGQGTIGLCERSRSLVLVGWLTGEHIEDLVEAVSSLIEQAEAVDARLAGNEDTLPGAPPGVGIRA